MKKYILLMTLGALLVACKPSDKDFINLGESVVKDTLKDPESAQFESFYKASGEKDGYVCGYVNAKNSYGGYTGKKPYYVYIETDNGKLINKGPVIIIGDDEKDKLENYEAICQKN